jgi:hypothetical protein
MIEIFQNQNPTSTIDVAILPPWLLVPWPQNNKVLESIVSLLKLSIFKDVGFYLIVPWEETD